MSLLNQYIARKANKEDDCTGRFWEGRFKSQALLTEKAVLACMSYVDLNPIRAGIARDLQGSKYTSIRRRLKSADVAKGDKLTPFNRKRVSLEKTFLCTLRLSDYVKQLVVIVKQNNSQSSQIIKMGSLRLNQTWVVHSTHFEKSFGYAAGSQTKIDEYRKLVRNSIISPKLLN
ncbi:hypothetical protein [Glaciecola sp. SC05]|uniref:hypothetical protein n=1 Tax=Glaciecola sp. SC05 TaxID=1987355 RepID=UPI003528183B